MQVIFCDVYLFIIKFGVSVKRPSYGKRGSLGVKLDKIWAILSHFLEIVAALLAIFFSKFDDSQENFDRNSKHTGHLL